MRTRVRRLVWVASVVLALLLLATPQRGFAQLEGSAPFSEAGTSAKQIDAFLARLKTALNKDDRAAVCRMVAYPARVWDGRKSVTVRNAKELRRHFDDVFSPELRRVVNAASSQTAWANWQGVMFDSGRIWLAVGDDGRLRILTINPPVGPAGAGR